VLVHCGPKRSSCTAHSNNTFAEHLSKWGTIWKLPVPYKCGFSGWKRILEKEYSVTNSLFVDFFWSRKGKKYCEDFCQASPWLVYNMKGCLQIFLLSYFEDHQIWLSILMEMANRKKRSIPLVLSPLQGEWINWNLYMLATNSSTLANWTAQVELKIWF
jgi:hypothetical protein